MIVSSGYNIGGPEVEAAIDTHPDVAGVRGRGPRRTRSAARSSAPSSCCGTACAAAATPPRRRRSRTTSRTSWPRTSTRATSASPPRCRATRAASCSTSPCGRSLEQGAGGGAEPRTEERGHEDRRRRRRPRRAVLRRAAKQLNPAHEITVWERNAPDDTFGFGVVFSDETLGGIENADTGVRRRMAERFARWTDIDIHYRGQSLHRRRPGLRGDEPQGAARAAAGTGAPTRRHRPLPHRRRRTPSELRATHDLVVAADGVNSRDPGAVRRRVPPGPGPAAQQVHVARHRPRLRGVPVLHQADAVGHHADARLPLLRRRLHVHRGDARGRVAPGRLRRDREHRASRPAPATSPPSRRLRELFAGELAGTSCSPTTPSG